MIELTEVPANDSPLIPWSVKIARLDNGDGTHAILVDSVEVATVPSDDATVSAAIRSTCERFAMLEARPA